ncbi:MAG: glycosyl hydrolase 53 family protein [Bacteroidales bacterium]|nr:glycosyl hydrolase 53 family protein [Bacteroidales bacterium]
MKYWKIFTILSLFTLVQCNGRMNHTDYSSIETVKKGKPVSVMLTCYSTTLIGNGTDHTHIRIAVVDSLMRQISGATDSIDLFVYGNGTISDTDGNTITYQHDSSGANFVPCKLENGVKYLQYTTGDYPDTVKIVARSKGLWEASHELHILQADFKKMKPSVSEIMPNHIKVPKMIGADISWLPQLEARGIKFYENGKVVDPVKLLAEHGMNFIRLRIFVHPGATDGYAPGTGYCGLKYTLAMAKRVKEAGMKLLLDFHYSDTWADPQKQYTPESWSKLDYQQLKDTVYAYTVRTLEDFKAQGTLPDMVQVGNEINHGFLWPMGHISHPDQLAGLLREGVAGVKAVNPETPVMMHLALGGQNQEAKFWLDNMLARGVKFDVIGLSYYPRWHGTLEDLKNNLHDLALRYHKPIYVAEYSDFKKTVTQISFSEPNGLGKGSCIWEPLNWRSRLFNKKGKVTPLMDVYNQLHKDYLKN